VVIVRTGVQGGAEFFLGRSTVNLGSSVAVVKAAVELPITPPLANAVLVERVEATAAT
jgi:hypothetical protein